ncbi:MAG TPA: ATP-binding protein [Cyclobacteriaceae bacterium]|nr:ATP-binding protein [Cyclobacteriaceae bacterium]
MSTGECISDLKESIECLKRTNRDLSESLTELKKKERAVEAANRKLKDTKTGLQNTVRQLRREVTQLKDRDTILTEGKRVAEEASRMKEEFVSFMSHEIRTSLNSVIGLTVLLQRRKSRVDQIEIVQTLKDAGDNLLYLVSNILDYNKLRAGKVDQENVQFNLSEYIRKIHTSSKMMAQVKGIGWELKVDPSLPDIVRGDVGRLNQILSNLINNAIKFTPKGHIQLGIQLRARVENTAYILFTVRDTGIGIADDKRNSVFVPFFQATSYPTQNPQGTGLGLSIVKGLVDLLKGHIHWESTPGKGSAFSMELPFEIPASEEIRMAGKEQPPDLPIKLKGCKVLYVEDVESNRFVIKSLLSDYEIEITAVSSGLEALLLTNQFSFDVILMDIQMPELDGYLTIEAIRQQAKGKNRMTPMIAFTASLYSDELREKLINDRIQDIIFKPFDTVVLLEKIASARIAPSLIKSGREQVISFRFYEIALRYDKQKCSAVKSEIIQDLCDLQRELNVARHLQDVKEVQKRIHSLIPIVSNLECKTLRNLFYEYRTHAGYTQEVDHLNQKIQKRLVRAIKALKELPY